MDEQPETNMPPQLLRSWGHKKSVISYVCCQFSNVILNVHSFGFQIGMLKLSDILASQYLYFKMEDPSLVAQ